MANNKLVVNERQATTTLIAEFVVIILDSSYVVSVMIFFI